MSDETLNGLVFMWIILMVVLGSLLLAGLIQWIYCKITGKKDGA